jgi:1,4-dihydroxy-2-naphthoate octaprenyltransferase
MPYLLLLSAGVAGVVPLLVPLVCLLSLPQARDLVQFAFMNHTVPAAIAPLKRWAIKWHVAMAACLIAGQLGAGLVPAVLA